MGRIGQVIVVWGVIVAGLVLALWHVGEPQLPIDRPAVADRPIVTPELFCDLNPAARPPLCAPGDATPPAR